MDAIQPYLEKKWVWGVAGLLLGLILGVLYAWVIDPVEWSDASVRHLRADLQEDYLRLAIDDFARTQDVSLAQLRWAELEPLGDETLAVIAANPAGLDPIAIAAYGTVVTGVVMQPPGSEPGLQPTTETGVLPGTDTGVEPEAGGRGLGWLTPVLLVIILAVILTGGFYFLRRRGTPLPFPARPVTSAQKAEFASQGQARTDYAAIGQEPPINQFMTTFMLGDDLYDDAFSIDSPAGEFLGECGVGIADTIGVGDPKRVTAFEVWLFDKNDIQTVTKVLMSEHAFDNFEIRQRLAAKGEPVLAEPGTQVTLTTATLRLEARVVDLAYGEPGPHPQSSHFERITLELAVWPVEM